MSEAIARPGVQLLARLADDPVAKGEDEAGFCMVSDIGMITLAPFGGAGASLMRSPAPDNRRMRIGRADAAAPAVTRKPVGRSRHDKPPVLSTTSGVGREPTENGPRQRDPTPDLSNTS